MKYYIDEPIGEPGGFGDVFKCHSENGDLYAIKILKTDNTEAILRFQKEVRLTSRLNHPNIIRIIAYDTSTQRKYYIMPKYNCSLAQIIPDLYNKYDRQYKVVTEILNGLIYLHEQGVLHRDLKPQNILYNSDTDIAISDLGFSRQSDSDSFSLTNVGDVFGTERYISPEQILDSKNVDNRTDIYAFGTILEDIVTSFMKYKIPNDEFGYIIDKCRDNHIERRFFDAKELKKMIDNVYQNLLRISSSDFISNNISLLELGSMDYSDIEKLALKIMSNSNKDYVEKFFFAIDDKDFIELEKKQQGIMQKLIADLMEYYISQIWGFNYTDIIGDLCKRLYNLSNDGLNRARLFFAILDVGIWHNRYYVMRIAERILQNLNNNSTETMVLYELLKNSKIDLSKLNIFKKDLPTILWEFYDR